MRLARVGRVQVAEAGWWCAPVEVVGDERGVDGKAQPVARDEEDHCQKRVAAVLWHDKLVQQQERGEAGEDAAGRRWRISRGRDTGTYGVDTGADVDGVLVVVLELVKGQELRGWRRGKKREREGGEAAAMGRGRGDRGRERGRKRKCEKVSERTFFSHLFLSLLLSFSLSLSLCLCCLR